MALGRRGLMTACLLEREQSFRDPPMTAAIYDIEVTTIDGRQQAMNAYRGQVLLIVNVASRCGFTPQYEELEALYRRHQDAGLAVLGFPCDQFGHQEPGNEAEIKSFCQVRYGVTFPLFAKIQVNGRATHPLFRFLKSARRGLLGTRFIKWNFTKFLVDRQGAVVARYAPTVPMGRIETDIERLLAAGADVRSDVADKTAAESSTLPR